MITTNPTMQDLFAQLGLPDAPQDIQAFVQQRKPLPMTMHLADAPFWTDSQAALIRQKLSADDDWSHLIDSLSAQLREHPASADLPQGSPDDDPDLQGEGNISAARRYDAAAQAFVASGQVDEAARAAEPRSAEEARSLREAERVGLAKAKD